MHPLVVAVMVRSTEPGRFGTVATAWLDPYAPIAQIRRAPRACA